MSPASRYAMIPQAEHAFNVSTDPSGRALSEAAGTTPARLIPAPGAWHEGIRKEPPGQTRGFHVPLFRHSPLPATYPRNQSLHAGPALPP